MLQRYLVRKEDGAVFIWSEIKAQRKDLVEVWAESAELALKRDPLPEPNTISLEQIEAMTKSDMLMFASYKLGLKLDGALTKGELADRIKEAIFTRAAPAAPEDAAAMVESAPFASPQSMLRKTGVEAKFSPPKGDNAVASADPHQPVRP